MNRVINYPGLPRTRKVPCPRHPHPWSWGNQGVLVTLKGFWDLTACGGSSWGESGLSSLPGVNHTDGRLPAGPCVPAQSGHSLGALPALLS